MDLWPGSQNGTAKVLMQLSPGVFFLGGFVTTLVSLLVPRLKLAMALSYADALLVQLAFHASYLLFSLPIVLLLVKIGYMRAIATGLAIMVAGCLSLAFSFQPPDLAYVLGALLLLSIGQTFLQMACNTVIAVVGDRSSAASRLTLLQGFNSLGTTLAPLIGAPFLLGNVSGRATGMAVDARAAAPFILCALVLALLAILFALNRNLLGEQIVARRPTFGRLRVLMANRCLKAGTLAIFAYVGAEVTIGSLLTNYLMLKEVLGTGPVAAGRLLSLYWGGAMIGRFAGAYLLRRLPAPSALWLAALAAALLAVGSAFPIGLLSAVTLLAVGLCNSIMYPTIYALALPEEEEDAAPASVLLCMAVVGGAVIPVMTGFVAGAVGLPMSLILPAGCYGIVAVFALSCSHGLRNMRPISNDY